MSPEAQAQFNELKQRVEQLENVRNTLNVENIDNELILSEFAVNTSKITRVESDTVGVDGGTVEINTLSYPDKWLLRRWKGKTYLIPAYDLDKK